MVSSKAPSVWVKTGKHDGKRRARHNHKYCDNPALGRSREPRCATPRQRYGLDREPLPRGKRRSKFSALFSHDGMKFGRAILGNAKNDRLLASKIDNLGIESQESMEYILLQLLFEARVLNQWEVTDGLVDVFTHIKGKLEWATDIPIVLFIQLFYAVLNARLQWFEHPSAPFDRKEHCAVAIRADRLMKWINGANGVEHLMGELKIFVQFIAPISMALDSMSWRDIYVAVHRNDLVDRELGGSEDELI